MKKSLGSLSNRIMENNNSVPVVGKGATEMHYSDRTCYEVVEVSKDGLTCKLQALEAVADRSKPCGTGHQNWILNPTNNFTTLKMYRGKWCTVANEVVFTKEYIKSCTRYSLALGLTKEQHDAVYAGNVFPKNVVDGITEAKTKYYPIRILFGVKDYYYDWSF